MHTPASSAFRRPLQHGLGLVELLVGMTLGLLTISVAIGTLLLSRQTAGAVNDAAQLQQQAAHALRIIGQQARQAGSVRLNLAFGKDSALPIDAGDPVAFEAPPDFDPRTDTVSGTTSPAAHEYLLAFTRQNYAEALVGSAVAQSQLRDCLGQAPSDSVLRSGFSWHKATGTGSGELHCAGSDGQRQAVIANVADVRVRFLVRTNTASGQPLMQYRTADEVTHWRQAHAVEVCLEMVGTEHLPDTGARYTDCSHQSVARGNRLRLVFRNTFHIRSQDGAP